MLLVIGTAPDTKTAMVYTLVFSLWACTVQPLPLWLWPKCFYRNALLTSVCVCVCVRARARNTKTAMVYTLVYRVLQLREVEVAVLGYGFCGRKATLKRGKNARFSNEQPVYLWIGCLPCDTRPETLQPRCSVLALDHSY